MCMRRGGAMLRRRGVASLDCRVVGADERWLQWWPSDDKVSARLQRVKQRWCSQCSSTNARSRSCVARGWGPWRVAAMPLMNCQASALSRQVARTNHHKGVSQDEKKTDISARRRLPRQNGFGMPGSLLGLGVLASSRRAIRGLRVCYFDLCIPSVPVPS